MILTMLMIIIITIITIAEYRVPIIREICICMFSLYIKTKFKKNYDDVFFLVAPPIIESTGNKTALLGENVFLQCLAFSTEPIKITWYKNNKEIKTKGRFVITTDLQVAISNAMVDDSGWYFCVAANSGGKSVASFHFKVYGMKIDLFVSNTEPLISNETCDQTHKVTLK